MEPDGWFRTASDGAYMVLRGLLYPLNWILACTKKSHLVPDSCLHISYMVHIPWHTVRLLRKHGWHARYLAIGKSPTWNRCDYNFVPSKSRHIRRLQEFLFFWMVVAKYEVIHSHFLMFLSESGWEDQWLKRLGRKTIVNYRGCDLRERKKNVALNPEYNICDRCDYGHVCEEEYLVRMRERARAIGDLFLVTTPDMKDFDAAAIHFPFFAPEIEAPEPGSGERKNQGFRIVHVSNHPGIEGTEEIRKAIDRVIAKGYEIDFVQLSHVPYDRVIEAFAEADLAIGKMKMGYYANAQIESMAMGVPTITYVRPEYVTEELRESGFILANLNHLEETIQYYIDHPEALREKRQRARRSVLEMHNNDELAQRLIGLYRSLQGATGGDHQ